MDAMHYLCFLLTIVFTIQSGHATQADYRINDKCYFVLPKEPRAKFTFGACSKVSDPLCQKVAEPLRIITDSDFNAFEQIAAATNITNPVWSSEKLLMDHPRNKFITYKGKTIKNALWVKGNACRKPPLSVPLRVFHTGLQIVFYRPNNDPGCWFPVRNDTDYNYTVICQSKQIVKITTSHLTAGTSEPSLKTAKSTESSILRNTSVPLDRRTTLSFSHKPTPKRAKTCASIDFAGIVWPETNFGDTAVQKCPNGNGEAKWKCSGETGQFLMEDFDETSCTGKILRQSLTRNCLGSTLDAYVNCIDSLVTSSSKDSDLTGTEVSTISAVMFKRVYKIGIKFASSSSQKAVESYSARIRKYVVEVFDNLMNDNLNSTWRTMTQSDSQNTAAILMSTTEKVIFINPKPLPKTYATSLQNFGFKSFLIEKNSQDTFNYFDNTIASGDAYISLQKTNNLEKMARKAEPNVKVLFGAGFTFRNLPKYLTLDKAHSALKVNEHTKISSLMMGMSFNHSRMRFNTNAVRILIPHSLENGQRPRCVFWNSSSPGWSGGFWDGRGCAVVRSNTSATLCQCNHLTNFAVLMDFNQQIKPDSMDNKIQTWMTNLLLPVSILCLIATIVVFSAIRVFRTKKNMITVNLCVCLAVSQMLILVMDTKHIIGKVGCMVIAISLHYSLLAAFAWFLLEGYCLYNMVIKVFNANNAKSVFYFLFGYGIPVLITGTAGAIKPDGYSSASESCWLSYERGFQWSFIGPIISVIFINLILFTLALKSSFSVKQNIDMKKQMLRRLKGSITLLFILGITWTFGLFFFFKEGSFIAYIFVLLNTSQGIFIFLFQIAFNKLNRQEIVKVYRKRFLQNQNSFTSVSTLTTTVKSVSSNPSTVHVRNSTGSSLIKKN